MKLRSLQLAVVLSVCSLAVGVLRGAEEGKVVDLGKYRITVPGTWKQQQPKSGILMYEFSSPAVEGDKTDGRMTVMAAGGSVEANIERWYGQFSQPDGTATRDRAKTEKRTIAGRDVHVVDITGTYREQFGGNAESPNYRMLAAIIVTPEANFFLKYYGPRKTITANEKAFKEMVESLSAK